MDILLAEDDDLIAYAMADAFESLGWTVRHARNGFEALAMGLSERPTVLVTDLNMPVMDGYALINDIRCQIPDLPIVVLTGRPPANRERTFRDCGHGPLVLLEKPIQMQGIVDAICGCVSRSPCSVGGF